MAVQLEKKGKREREFLYNYPDFLPLWKVGHSDHSGLWSCLARDPAWLSHERA